MKKFARILAIVLAIATLTAMFAACTKQGEDKGKDNDGTTAASGSAADGNAPAEVEKIVFGTNAEFPPFEFVNNAGGVIEKFDGIDMAIADQIAKDNGMTAEISNMEFDSLLIALENGQIDAAIAGMTVTEKRLKSVDFSTPYYEATQVMIVKEGSDIELATDMADKKIAVIQGYTGETAVKKLGYEYTSFKKGTDAVLELVNGKADVVVIDSATAGKYVADNEGLKIVVDNETFEKEEYAIAVKKGNKELLEKINGSVEKMLMDGTIAEFAAKYAVAE